jgi:tetraacyldisaccharide 4'-kinase
VTPVAALLRLRRRLYGRGILPRESSSLPTISVGNLAFGGTGKTPLVAAMADLWLSRRRRVAILLRGYRRKSRGVVVVSDGRRVLCGVRASGDEAALHARLHPEAIVIVAERRIDAARRAEELGAEILLLDDAFQHLKLERDLDVVLLACRSGNGDPRPFGRLREPLSALGEADIVVLSRCDGAPEESAASEVRRWNREAPIFASRVRLRGWIGADGAILDARAFADRPVGAVCAVGDPSGFRRTIEEAGARLVFFRAFRDHHAYSRRGVRRVARAARRAGAESLLTTGKDWVKIEPPAELPLFEARIDVEIDGDFEGTVDRMLAARGAVV